MGRLDPIPPREWPASMREALAVLRPPESTHAGPPSRDDRPKGRNALGFLAHHPELTRAFNTFNGHILFSTTLTARQRELVVLRVATLRDAEYEWTQHVVLAGDAGISDDEIERVRSAPDHASWSPLERALLAAVDQLVDHARIDDDAWSVLVDELDERQLMDVVFTVGAYELLAMAFRTFDVALDPDLEPTARKWASPK